MSPSTKAAVNSGNRTIGRIYNGILIVSYAEYPGAFGLSKRIEGIRSILSNNGVPNLVLCPLSTEDLTQQNGIVNLGPAFFGKLRQSTLGRALAIAIFSLMCIPPIIASSIERKLVIQYESLFSAFPAIVAKVLLRQKIIGDEVILMSYDMQPPLRYFIHALDRFLVRMTDHIATSSRTSYAVIREWFPTKSVSLVPNGVVPVEDKHTRVLDMHEAIFVGALSSCENRGAVQNVLSLARILEQKGIRFHTYIVGGPLAFVTQHLNDQMVKQGRVTFTGILSDEALLALYKRTSIGLLPFFTSSSGGQRIKGLEYLAHGLLVISGPHGFGYLPEISSQKQYLQAEDVQGMGELIAKCVSDPTRYSRVAVAGRTFVESRFSWAAVCKPYMDIVRKLLRSSNPAEVK